MRLSICIPTHDGRARPLKRALDSILEQLDGIPEGTVEICVSDNGSRDETRAVVEERRRRHPGLLRFHRFDENQGFTANLLRVVDEASGEFCWLFSSDDAVTPDGIARVLALLDRHPDVTGAMTRPVASDLDRGVELQPFYPDLIPERPELEHRWHTVRDAIVGCGAAMGVLPAQIVRRESWQEAVRGLSAEELAEYPRFPHLLILYRMVLRRPEWAWDPGPSFLMRTEVGNSVVADLGGHLTRYHLETTAETIALWRGLLGDATIVHQLLAKTRRAMFRMDALLMYKVVPGQQLSDDARLLRRTMGWFWRVPAYWASVPILLLPHPAARMLLRIGRAAVGARRRAAAPA